MARNIVTPQPPVYNTPSSVHKSLKDIISFIRQTFSSGAKHPEFSQDEIDAKVSTNDLGTIVFNSDTGESNVSYLDGSTVKWRAF